MRGDFIQIDYSHPTGTVDVKLDSNGQPNYIINRNAAWDFLELSDSWKKLAADIDVVCFGTLAQRSLKSRRAIINFLKAVKENTIKVFDINLRQNFYSIKIIIESLKFATISIKAKQLHTLGMSYQKIAESLNTSEVTIVRACKYNNN